MFQKKSLVIVHFKIKFSSFLSILHYGVMLADLFRFAELIIHVLVNTEC